MKQNYAIPKTTVIFFARTITES